MHCLVPDITEIYRAPFSSHSGINFFLAQPRIDLFVGLNKAPLESEN